MANIKKTFRVYLGYHESHVYTRQAESIEVLQKQLEDEFDFTGKWRPKLAVGYPEGSQRWMIVDTTTYPKVGFQKYFVLIIPEKEDVCRVWQ